MLQRGIYSWGVGVAKITLTSLEVKKMIKTVLEADEHGTVEALKECGSVVSDICIRRGLYRKSITNKSRAPDHAAQQNVCDAF